MLIIRLFLLVCLLLLPADVCAGRQSLPSASVFLVAEELLDGLLEREDGTDYRVERLTRLPPDLFLPEGPIEMVAALVGSLRYNSPVQVRITISVNNSPQMNLFTAWRIRKFTYVLVTVRDIPSRTILSEADVVLEQREVVKLDDVLFSLDGLTDLETKRPLTAGSIVSRAVLGRPQIIRTGDTVTIVSRVGPVAVQAFGQALQAGGVGDIIRVRNLNSGKSVLAKIESGNIVVVVNTLNQ